MNNPFIQSLISLAVKTAIVLLITVGIFRFVGPLPISINTKTLDKDSTFFVTSEASVFVKPDLARVTLTASPTSVSADTAQSNANKIINDITSALVKLGIKEENIKTVNYNIFPIYDDKAISISAYRADISIEIKDKELDRVNKIVDTAINNGANQVSGIYFEVENREEALDEARKQAINKAKEKAAKISNESGIKLGRIINVSEYSPTEPFFMNKYAGGIGAGGAAEDTNVQPGQTEIKISVTLSYETF